MSKKSGPLESIWNAALLLLGVSLALWCAVQLISSIWIWLLVGGGLAGAVYVYLQWRRRRNRW